MAPLTDGTITLPEGRRLAYTEWGNPKGSPVFYFHGTPGSRLWCPDESATASANVRLVMPDRPGIGRSEVKEGRTLADWPTDVIGLANAPRIDSFAVVGVSAGGPYAASCAALIPSRLSAVGIVSSVALAKYNYAERPGAYEEWNTEQRAEFDVAQHDPLAAAELAAAHFAKEAAELDRHPEKIHEALKAAEGDRWFFDDEVRADTFDAYIRETFRQGVNAIRWELVDVFLPWGFQLAEIPVHVHIWHGEQDPWVKQAHIDFTASRIQDCTVVVWPDSGHLGFVKHWDEILETLT
jgi:pimeloyl-ACP methyl ester carboxylesterase